MIYLPNREDRWRPTLDHLRSNGIDPILFRGIDAVEWKLKTDKSENTWPFKFTSGRIGCFISHYMLWNHLYHSSCERMVILEDDVRVATDFHSNFSNNCDQLPTDWEFVHIGSLWDKEVPDRKFSDNLLIGKPYCTHAYMIKHSILSKLLNECSQLETYLDIQLMRKVLPFVKQYVFDPPLINQKSLSNDFGNYRSLCRDWDTGL